MKRIPLLSLLWCLGLLAPASTCFAQMYTVTDIGTLGYKQSEASGINGSGHVVGRALANYAGDHHAFRTAANSPINPATDDLGAGGGESNAQGINASGQVVGACASNFGSMHAFRTAPNSPINLATDDLGTFDGRYSGASGINDSGQVVGGGSFNGQIGVVHAFRTAANSPINPATDDLGTLGGTYIVAEGINESGQVVGFSNTTSNSTYHAFLTVANRPINPATDDIGTLGGRSSEAHAINDFGQLVGYSYTINDPNSLIVHAFRTAANSPINPATDDLGTLDGSTYSEAFDINNFGQVVGDSYGFSSGEAFLYDGGAMHDLNNLIPADAGWKLSSANGINDAGQIAGQGVSPSGQYHAFLLIPIYRAFVRPPINGDGSSVFSAKRGVVPVKFTLTQNDVQTCNLPPATIAITRAAGDTLASVDESIYVTPAESSSNFKIDTACQYHYNLAASSLGVGTYRVDISINGIFVGHAVFALK